MASRGRATMGIYNSYDPSKFREPHRRALARAGDLAYAFGMNLALFGFPIPEDADTPAKTAEWVAGTTSIGGHGDYFVRLAQEGRFLKFPYPSKGFPPQLGEMVLTTCKPSPQKSISAPEVAAMLASGQSVLLVFGLGPKGTPKDVAKASRYDLDITGGGYSLETCTAMGAVAGALAHILGQ